MQVLLAGVYRRDSKRTVDNHFADNEPLHTDVPRRVRSGQVTAQEPHIILAELWFEDEPEIDRAALLSRVREHLPESELKPDGPVLVAHLRYQHTYADGERGPIITALLEAGAGRRSLKHEPDTTQTYDWDEADAVLERCGHSLLVTELFGRLHPYENRVDAYRTTLTAAVELLAPAAVWCPNSTRVIEPAVLLDDPAAPFVNVRMFRIEGEPGILVMDTLGLHVLGLPDFQCHFRDLEPGRMAAKLYDLAAYVLENGDVIESGHTVSGVGDEEHWRCQREDALVAPDRLVLDIDPGEPFAAGKRDP